jgi:hypothetical protein
MIRRVMRHRLSAFAVFSALVACFALACGDIGISGTTPTPPSGIKGTVVLGPTCPVGGDISQTGAVPSACLTPYAAQLVVLDDENKVVKRIASGGDGTFQVDLDPGDYVIAPTTGTDSYPIAQPVSVTVTPGQYAMVEINYDTGIR